MTASSRGGEDPGADGPTLIAERLKAVGEEDDEKEKGQKIKEGQKKEEEEENAIDSKEGAYRLLHDKNVKLNVVLTSQF